MRKIIISLILFVSLFFSFQTVSLAYNPTSVLNNHFGIHVADTGDLTGVNKLVNSQGGDWGYVTFVIQKGERDPGRWQSAFDEMRRLHLIPIVRIATQPVGAGNNIWEKPNVDEIDGWVSFLSSLNWVIKNRYVIIGNEPNHASEWGGEVDPSGYGQYLKVFSSKLKAASEDFFIMPAGLDASATNTRITMDEALYLQQMVNSDPNVFKYIDGLASHSYANPDFSGSGDGSGKGTVRTFEWELNYLKFLGISKNLPVFITETGWTHETDSLTTDIGGKIETAFKNAWNDSRIVAVTPFIYKYTTPPFDTFSWVNKDEQFYDFYYNVFNLSKVAGRPVQDEKGEIITGIIPKIAAAGSSYRGIFFIKNTGESIWQLNHLGAVDLTDSNKLTIESMYPTSVEPNQIGLFMVNGKFPYLSGTHDIQIAITSNGGMITKPFDEQVNLIPKIPTLSEILDYIKITLLKKVASIF